MELHWFTDGSHSWLRVPRQMIFKAGLASQVSRFSYEKRLTVHGNVVEDVVFLEEDCDAPLFLNACHGPNQRFTFVERSGIDAFGIRDLPRFNDARDIRTSEYPATITMRDQWEGIGGQDEQDY